MVCYHTRARADSLASPLQPMIGITQAARADSLASPLHPTIWYDQESARADSLASSHNDLVSAARADSLASPLQPMIWYHTIALASPLQPMIWYQHDRRSCFTITAKDLVSHKGSPSRRSCSPLQPKIWYHTWVSTDGLANDLVSYKGQQ